MVGVRVFGSLTSAAVARVLTCLFEKDVEFLFIRLDTYEKQDSERMPESLKLQPREAVTYEDDQVILSDYIKICLHISKRYSKQGNKYLLGTTAHEKKMIEEVIELRTPGAPIVRSIFAQFHVEEWMNNPDRNLDDLRVWINFNIPNKFTLVDLMYLPNLQCLATNERSKALIERDKNLNRWWGDISRRASWQKVMTMQQELPPITEK